MYSLNQGIFVIEAALAAITFLVLFVVCQLKWVNLKGKYLPRNVFDIVLVGSFVFSFAWISVEIVLLSLLHHFFEPGPVTLYQLRMICLLLLTWLFLGIVVGFSDRASLGAVIGVMVIAPIGSFFAGIIGFLGGFFATAVATPFLITLGRVPEHQPDLLKFPFFIGSALGTGFSLVALTGLLPAAAIMGAITGLLTHTLYYFRKKDGID